jgi:dinuclear metal center YbgI/SA1388 family protein
MLLHELVSYLEHWASPNYQESYDNSGLITGNPDQEITGVIVSLDCTEEVIDEAISKNCNVIVSHHPIVFKGLKSFTGKTYVERTIIKAIRNDVAIYAIHTNLDSVETGVNAKIAEKLGLINTRILAPKQDALMKLTVFVPVLHTGRLLDALYEAGAGDIGNYSNCSFRTTGKGTFKANESANPSIGNKGVYEEVDETRIEVVFPEQLQYKVLDGMRKGHVYEEIAYYLTPLANSFQQVGSGMVGQLPEAMKSIDFLNLIKVAMQTPLIRYTSIIKPEVKTIAVCGGSGSFLLPYAKHVKADVFVTADYKYHEFFDAEEKLIIADIGHYESEQFTKELIRDALLKKFTNFATYLSDVKTNPVNYLI